MKTEDLQALLDKATPGPWYMGGLKSFEMNGAPFRRVYFSETSPVPQYVHILGKSCDANAALIAAAPKLAAENLKLRATLAKIADEKLTIGRSLHATLNQIILDAKTAIKTLEETE